MMFIWMVAFVFALDKGGIVCFDLNIRWDGEGEDKIRFNESFGLKGIFKNNQDQDGDEYQHLTEVSLSANAYITKRGQNGHELISKDGLHKWTSNDTIISIYFYAKNAIKFDLLIKCKVLPNGESKLQVSLDGTSHSVSVIGKEYHTFKVGSFEVKSRGYHKIDLRGIEKSGTYFAEVSHLMFGQSSADQEIQGITANPDRGSPSIHLIYKNPTNDNSEYYYNEVNVPNGYDTVGTYYMAVGFYGGYFGIQVNSETERRVLFSIWSPQGTGDPHKVTEENKIKLISKGNNVMVEDFGNEGTGGHAILKYKWTPETTYRFLVRGRPDPSEKTHSIYTAWFSAGTGTWQLIASFRKPKSGRYLASFYSFLEEFNPNTGYLTRKGRYCNQWICDSTGNWHEVISAEFTSNSSGEKKVRLDFEAGIESFHSQDCFYLKNGGFFEGKTKLHTHLIRKVNNVKPSIDFKKLPQ